MVATWIMPSSMDNGGLGSGESYHYHAKVEFCKYKPEDSAANDIAFVNTRNWEKSLMTAVASVGSISVGIDAGQDTFQF